MRTLPSVISHIGNPYLLLLYTALLRDTSLHTCLVAAESTKIIGVITATKDRYITQRQIRKLFFRPTIMWSIGKALVHRKISIPDLTGRIAFERELQRQFPAPYATILTFFVEKNHQHQGLGTKLLASVQKHLPKNSKLFVDTETSNARAQQWYKNHGFRLLKTISNNVISVKTLTPAAT